MKKRTKMLLASGITLMLGTGIVTSYLLAQPQEQVSDLTLANIEAMAVSEEDGIGPCCAPWENHCGTVEMENGLIYDVSGTPCS